MADEAHLPQDTLIFEGGDALKSLKTEDGQVTVGAYACRFTGPHDRDTDGDYFTANTNFGPRCGDGVATLFHHGMPIKGMERLREAEFGPARTRRDENGIFAETTLDLADPDQARIADLCAKGRLKWSSGSAEHLAKKAKDGEIQRWHICEFSFTPAPVDDRLPAILPLKSLAEVEPTVATALAEAFDAYRAAPAVDTGKQAAPADSAKSSSNSPVITMSDKTPEQLATEHKAEMASALKARSVENAEIFSIGKEMNCLDDARQFVSDGKGVNEFRQHVLSNVLKARPVDLTAGIVGMSDKELRKYSVLKACRDLAVNHKLEGLEREAHNAAMKTLGREVKGGLGFIIPDDVLRGNVKAQGGQIINSAPDGGFTMQPTMGPLIELLRNKMVLIDAGATQMGGLVGDCYLPKHLSGSTAYWVSETGTIPRSASKFGQIKLTPHRLGSSIPYSTQFLAQTSLDAESFIRNDADQVLAIEKDRAGIHGTGANGQPVGLVNTDGINKTVTYGGVAEWADVVEHETGIAMDNADIGTMMFLLSTATVGRWKTILKNNVAGAGYLLDANMTANGYTVKRTNQIAGNISIFGVMSQLIIASWSGREVIVDPYTLAEDGQVKITFNELCDIQVRQPLAFNVSTDSAAQ